MANCYWIGTLGTENWYDNDGAGNSPWSSSPGGSTSGTNPVDGDSVYFDINSLTAPAAGPSAPVALTLLETAGFTPAFTFDTNVNIAAAGYVDIRQTSVFTGNLGAGATATLDEAGVFAGTSAGSNTISFNGSSSNSAGSFGGTGNAISFAGTSVNNAPFTVAGSVAFSGSPVNNAVITATTCTMLGYVTGTGGLTGPVAMGDAGYNQMSGIITGDVTLTSSLSCYNYGPITGNVTVTGSGARNLGTVTGNITLVAGGTNTGSCTGTLTAPYSAGAGAWGAWGTLVLTGMPYGINGTGILGMV